MAFYHVELRDDSPTANLLILACRVEAFRDVEARAVELAKRFVAKEGGKLNSFVRLAVSDDEAVTKKGFVVVIDPLEFEVW